ncbi:MAG: hypothetical protein HQ578_00510 [Chloroflexi bacterium]|nr:hypothetical protein [Chloroflexota bacterium]
MEVYRFQGITLSCTEGDYSYVYDGIVDYEESEVDLCRSCQNRRALFRGHMNLVTEGSTG